MATQIFYPTVSNAQTDQNYIAKLQLDSLLGKLATIEKELKHYQKLKRRWNSIKNTLHYLKYPVCALMLGGDALLLATGVGAPLAIASSSLTVAELVGSNLIEDSVVRAKVNKYAAKVVHLKEWINRMYVFKHEALRDQILDQKEIELWNALLNEYAHASQKYDSTAAKNSEPNISKELKRLQEQMSSLVIKLNGDSQRQTVEPS